MRILLLITGLGMGGAERQVADLADSFAKLDHGVLLVYLTGEAVVLPTNPSIKVVGLGMRKTPLDFIRVYQKVARLVLDFKPDVVHSHMVHANLLARLIRLTVGFPRLICTAHNTNEGGMLRMFAYRLTDSLADISTNVSNEAVEAFIAKGAVKRGRMLAVSNGIDTERFKPDLFAREKLRKEENIGSEEKVLLAVGRLMEQKDYPNLLNSYALLDNGTTKTQLWIVGEGLLLPALEDLVKILGLDKRVKFLGVRHDVETLMNAADVFVLSSAWEGFGLVVGEAMACEKVVVATDCGGVKEVVGEAGILVPPQNSKELSFALRHALELSNENSQKLGKAGRQFIEKNFSLTAIADKWIKIYQEIQST